LKALFGNAPFVLVKQQEECNLGCSWVFSEPAMATLSIAWKNGECQPTAALLAAACQLIWETVTGFGITSCPKSSLVQLQHPKRSFFLIRGGAYLEVLARWMLRYLSF
jgi:hypothetical protein